MDLTKSYDFFNPNSVKQMIHIIGCGSIGSTLAENLVRCGLQKITLWDFDKVEQHNIVNQMFTIKHVGMNKVDALLDILTDINPDAAKTVKLKPAGWQGELLSGYIFLCVDNIDLRRTIVEKHIPSKFVKGVFDFRTLLTGAQHYAADWASENAKKYLLSTMQFTHEEAAAATPVSACGVTLGVCQTCRIICGFGTSNFISMVKGEGYKKTIQYNFQSTGGSSPALIFDEFDGANN